uniref:Uncharacterized protein n=1 Tax=Arundo donax TaxID=35708 RepID=A0A0A9FUA3_ARUDO
MARSAWFVLPRPKQFRQSILPVPLQMVQGGSGRFGLSLLTFDSVRTTHDGLDRPSRRGAP